MSVGASPIARATPIEAWCCLPRITLMLVRRAGHPGDLGDEQTALFAEDGVGRTEGLSVVSAAHDPVEPALQPVR